MKIKKHRIKQLIRESIARYLNEENSRGMEPSAEKAFDLLSPELRRLIDSNVDTDFMDGFDKDIDSMSNNYEIADKLDSYVEDLFEGMNNDINELVEAALGGTYADMLFELIDKIEKNEEINIQEYYISLNDQYFENNNDKFMQRNVEKIFKWRKEEFDKKIKKLNEEIAQKEKFKKSLEYDSNFPIACYSYIVTTDSYGVAIPESSAFCIVFKGSDKIENISGADFPILYKNGVEIFDIDPKKATGSASGNKVSPLVAEYKGKDYYLPMV